MSFLLDTDICSAHLKNDRTVAARVTQHFGSLHVSVATVGELLTWAMRAAAPKTRMQIVRDFLKATMVLDLTPAAAEKFGEVRASLLDRGITVGEMDLFNASVALVHNLTMVTHNVADYANIPGLIVVDWQVP
jgi:tRNA(fMet)-specific endonuclease VapC